MERCFIITNNFIYEIKSKGSLEYIKNDNTIEDCLAGTGMCYFKSSEDFLGKPVFDKEVLFSVAGPYEIVIVKA